MIVTISGMPYTPPNVLPEYTPKSWKKCPSILVDNQIYWRLWCFNLSSYSDDSTSCSMPAYLTIISLTVVLILQTSFGHTVRHPEVWPLEYQLYRPFFLSSIRDARRNFNISWPECRQIEALTKLRVDGQSKTPPSLAINFSAVS